MSPNSRRGLIAAAVLALAALSGARAAEAPAAPVRTIPDLHLRLAPIPAGSFLMGSPVSEVGRMADEGPQVPVTITHPFWLGEHPVTVGQWKKVMGSDLADQGRAMVANEMLYEIGTDLVWLWGIFRGFPTPLSPQEIARKDPTTVLWNTDDNLPMYCVGWEQAKRFCDRLNETETAAHRLPEGYEYRLPTEAEWEYACRAGTTTATYAGDLDLSGRRNAPVLDSIAWYSGNSSVGYQGRGWNTAPWDEKQYPGGKAGPRIVGTKTPNAWGLYDMLGNVYEWCGDWYGSHLPAGADPAGSAPGSSRVIRGGAWDAPAIRCRSAWRSGRDPTTVNFVGFRLALGRRLEPAARRPAAWAGARSVPDLDLQLLPIPAGTYLTGSPDREEGRWAGEGPQVRVNITRPFWLGQYPVTVRQWTKLMGTGLEDQIRRALQDDTGYHVGGKLGVKIRDRYGKRKDSDPASLVLNRDPDVPIHFVSWDDAAEFCRRLNQVESAAGRVPPAYEYRLPTEAEWEYACRAGTTTATYAGDLVILGRRNAPILDAIAWYAGNSSVGYQGHGMSTEDWPEKQYPGGDAGPRAVGLKQPNAWGLYDMLGNMNQWCWDWYRDDLPSGDDPHRPVSEVRAGDPPFKPLRGGSWNDSAYATRAASRDGSYTTWRSAACGFRIALAPRMNPSP